MEPKYYVKAIVTKRKVSGYGVYSSAGGMESEHDRFPISKDAQDRDGAASACLFLANSLRDDLNSTAA